MATEGLPINAGVLKWARVRSGFSSEELSAVVSPNYILWESGDALPSHPQLEKISDKLKVPIAVFFFPSPPDEEQISSSFRTLSSEYFASIPPRILQLIRKAKVFQLNLAEIFGETNTSERKIYIDIALKEENPDPDVVAEKIRKYLNIEIDTQVSWSSSEEALENWRQAVTGSGVFVFKDEFRQPEFTGFCLYDTQYPIIYVNNTSSKNRQQFTILHELVHILFGTSGLDLLDDNLFVSMSGAHGKIEAFCNSIAAKTLLPDFCLNEEIDQLGSSVDSATRIANKYKVSRELVFRGFLDRGLITKDQYTSNVAIWNKDFFSAKSKGGNYYNTQMSYLGKEYINLVRKRFHQGAINFDQVAEYFNIKPKNLAKFESYLSGREL